MTWRCPNCKRRNTWWKNLCSRCGVPVAGFKVKD